MRKIAVVLILAIGLSAQAAKFKKVVGQTFPEFKASCLVSGQEVDLQTELKKGENKGAVVVFTSYNCPVALAYDQRMAKLSEEYGQKVPFFFLDSNTSENGEKLKEYATQTGFKGVIAMDDGAKAAQAIGAGVTPEVYLLNTQGEVVYHGPVDDSQDPKYIEENYLADALKALASGAAIPEEKREVQPFGCGIQFPKK